VKRLWMTLALTVGLMVALAGCSPPVAVQPAVVCATIKPIALIVQAIAGSTVQVSVLANDGGVPLQNAHDLAAASYVVFESGTSFDAWASNIVPENVRLVNSLSPLTRACQAVRGCHSTTPLTWRAQ